MRSIWLWEGVLEGCFSNRWLVQRIRSITQGVLPFSTPRRNSGLWHVRTGGKQHEAQKENGLVTRRSVTPYQKVSIHPHTHTL